MRMLTACRHLVALRGVQERFWVSGPVKVRDGDKVLLAVQLHGNTDWDSCVAGQYEHKVDLHHAYDVLVAEKKYTTHSLSLSLNLNLKDGCALPLSVCLSLLHHNKIVHKLLSNSSCFPGCWELKWTFIFHLGSGNNNNAEMRERLSGPKKQMASKKPGAARSKV